MNSFGEYVGFIWNVADLAPRAVQAEPIRASDPADDGCPLVGLRPKADQRIGAAQGGCVEGAAGPAGRKAASAGKQAEIFQRIEVFV